MPLNPSLVDVVPAGMGNKNERAIDGKEGESNKLSRVYAPIEDCHEFLTFGPLTLPRLYSTLHTVIRSC